ncbi:MAG TPA: thiol:disulfide interchange protein DsbA/DsbL [Gammaproteobacteria bacterium]|nr:thiol:disulfide interchange protein DsbA/DsbL [Gammaproteobacteria bacterium]
MARRHGFTAAALVLFASAAFGQELQAGRDYDAVTPPQPTDDAGKVVVTEFFSYACPHCFALNPTLTIWVNKLPKDVRFERVAVVFGKGALWQKLAQIFYALNSIGKAEQLSPAVFGAVHVERPDWQTDAKIVDWMAAHGVNRAEFEAAFNSLSIRALVSSGDQLAQAHKVRTVPTLVVDGKYARQINDNGNGDFPQQLAIVDRLIDKARGEKKQ